MIKFSYQKLVLNCENEFEYGYVSLWWFCRIIAIIMNSCYCLTNIVLMCNKLNDMEKWKINIRGNCEIFEMGKERIHALYMFCILSSLIILQGESLFHIWTISRWIFHASNHYRIEINYHILGCYRSSRHLRK
jgi:hypothetical protein